MIGRACATGTAGRTGPVGAAKMTGGRFGQAGGTGVDEYLCITVVSEPGEREADFSGRLSQFWTHMLRDHPAEFERVYAETAAFEERGDRVSRQYLVEAGVVDVMERGVCAAGLGRGAVE